VFEGGVACAGETTWRVQVKYACRSPAKDLGDALVVVLVDDEDA
jgi:hypothetical protein